MSKAIKSVLEMDNKEARKFFMKSESYFSSKLPEYINFDGVLKSAKTILTSKKGQSKDVTKISELKTYRERDDLNYTIIMNKDGHYSWRPLLLIHPILYVDLVNFLTKKEYWEILISRFKKFQKNKKIRCYSIPIEAIKNSKKTDTGATILNWWENVEQESITKNIKYNFAMFTDITDCYPSIYTHSITWALYGKKHVKEDPDKCRNSFGDKIDKKITGMQYNQTNGLPQGSVLMGFIAELILGYADLMLGKRLKKERINEYEIIRYRDDYRIFSNSRNELERITSILSEELHELNFKLSSKKTFLTEDIVASSIKPEKLYWEQISSSFRDFPLKIGDKKVVKYSITIQKHLWEIKKLSNKFPNCGMLKKALTVLFKERIADLTSIPNDVMPMIGILVDIMIHNPVCLPQCVLNIGELLRCVDDKDARDIIESISKKYEAKPNSEYLVIWLQRLMLLFAPISSKFKKSGLTVKVGSSNDNKIFPVNWLNTKQQNLFDEDSLIDQSKVEEMSRAIQIREIEDFDVY